MLEQLSAVANSVVCSIKSTGKIPTYEDMQREFNLSKTKVASFVWDMCDRDLLPRHYKNFDWEGNCLNRFLLEEAQTPDSIVAARMVYDDKPRGQYLNESEYGILEAISVHVLRYSLIPTYVQISKLTNGKSRGHIHNCVQSMQHKGFVCVHRYKKGGLNILFCPWAMRTKHVETIREILDDESAAN